MCLALNAIIIALTIGFLLFNVSIGISFNHSFKLSAATSSPRSHKASTLKRFIHQIVNGSSQSVEKKTFILVSHKFENKLK